MEQLEQCGTKIVPLESVICTGIDALGTNGTKKKEETLKYNTVELQ